MKPSRELDALVAKQVMGWKSWLDDEWEKHRGPVPPGSIFVITPDIPHYSTSIAAAWEVVGKMAEASFAFYITNGFTWWADFVREDVSGKPDAKSHAEAPTAPLPS